MCFTRPVRLTPDEKAAKSALKKGKKYADGWGVMVTESGSYVVDGQAWIYFKTALAMEKKGVVKLDYQFGRIKLK